MKILIIINLLFIIGLFSIDSFDAMRLRTYSLYTSILIFLFSLVGNINSVNLSLLYLEKIGDFGNPLGFSLMTDMVSTPLITLTTFLIPFCILTSITINYRLKEFLFLILSTELILLIAFSTSSLFIFYVTFESVLIPIYLLIGMFGSRIIERTEAAYQIVIYTLFGSILLLPSLLIIYLSVGSFDFFTIKNSTFPPKIEIFLTISLFIALAIKIPMFPFYLWLTKAHVEAPTAGSVLLAGILLKLGSYGILRFLFLFPQGCKYLTPMILGLSIFGILNSLFASFRQIDLKRIIAYSSITHLNFANLGIFSYNNQGLLGSYSMIIFHGLVSSALFLSIGILYDRYKSRNIFYYRGLSNIMPLFSSSLFFFTLANIGFPGTANFIGELLIFIGICQANLLAAILSLSSVLFSGIIGFWMISRLLFGNYLAFPRKWYMTFISSDWKTPLQNGIADLNKREILILSPFILLILIFGVSPNLLLYPLEMNLYQLSLGLDRDFLNNIDLQDPLMITLLWQFAEDNYTL